MPWIRHFLLYKFTGYHRVAAAAGCDMPEAIPTITVRLTSDKITKNILVTFYKNIYNSVVCIKQYIVRSVICSGLILNNNLLKYNNSKHTGNQTDEIVMVVTHTNQER